MNPRESIAATLAALAPSEPFGLFLRHAEREEFPQTDPYSDVELTAAGWSSAAELGKRTASLLSWVAISPFRRCRQTARLLHPGAPEEDNRLGAPGPWVVDQTAGEEAFARLGTAGVVRAQIQRTPLDAIRGLAEGSALLLSAALERIAAGRGSGACITHDAVLMPAIHWLTGDPLPDWLQPLDGMAIQRQEDHLVCVWRGRLHPLKP
ncbi:MAG TPA: histidine phosphatase family protein [Myxococcaceae bacterium]|jgi:broad specificity phosphatase PhoE